MTTERKVDGWIDDLVGALFDPIIVMPGGWGDDLPEWLRTRVTLERLGENIVALREGRELTATDAEVACYLFTASLTAPMGSDWTQIYLYVAGQVIEKVRVVKCRPAGLALSIQGVHGGTDFLGLCFGGNGKVAISENQADNVFAVFGDGPDSLYGCFQLWA
ncbi:unnamed protein product, partial [marine sediment metagenome]